MAANDSWMYQGRDEKGRFGNGTSPNSDHGDPGSGDGGSMLPPGGGVWRCRPYDGGRADAVHGASGPERRFAAEQNPAGLESASGLGRDSFRERFLGGAGSDEIVDHLRKAADNAARATTSEQQRDAAGELATAWRLVGPARWLRFIAAAHDRALATSVAAGTGQAASAVVTKVQELLLTPRVPLLAEPPKGIIPRLMERIPRQSGSD